MRSLACLAALLTLGALSACAFRQAPAPALPARVAAPTPPQLVDAGGATIEKIPFHTGVSSATVEKMARQQGCTGGQGAGLITQAGPVEVYRMQCDNGKVFMARCELRQCRAM